MSFEDEIEEFLSGGDEDDAQGERSAHEPDPTLDEDSESDSVNGETDEQEDERSQFQARFEEYGKVVSQLAAEGWEAIEEGNWGHANLLYSSISKTAENIMVSAKAQFIDELNERFFPDTI